MGSWFFRLRSGNSSLTVPEHAGKLLTELNRLRSWDAYCDVLLQADDFGSPAVGPTGQEVRGVPAHSVVLAAASPFFQKLFNISQEKCSLPVIVIKDVELETLRMLVEKIYFPEPLVDTVENARALLAAATMLEVADVRHAASTCLAHSLNAENVLAILATAERHYCIPLAAYARKYINDNLEHVLQADAILPLALGELTALLARDRLAPMEEHVLDAILRWTQHRPQERRRHLQSLLRGVRLRLVPRAVLAQHAYVEPLASERWALLQIAEALAPSQENSAATSTVEQPELDKAIDGPERRASTAAVQKAVATLATDNAKDMSTSVAIKTSEKLSDSHSAGNVVCLQSPGSALLVMGGWTGVYPMNTTMVCPLPDGQWQPLVDLPEPREAAGAALFDGRVYLIGGCGKDRFLRDTVLVYDASVDSWSTGPKMTLNRSLMGVATLGSRIYAVGGKDDSTSHRSLTGTHHNWALDPREGVWRSLAPMPTRRRGLGVAALGEKLYAVGGYDEKESLNITERYDPVADGWESAEPMTKYRWGVGVGVIDNVIYAVGGRHGSATSSVERYSEGSGWEIAPAMAAPRSNAAVTTHGGRLYVVCGRDNYSRLSTVLMFNPATDAWSNLPDLPSGRSSPAAVIIEWTPRAAT